MSGITLGAALRNHQTPEKAVMNWLKHPNLFEVDDDAEAIKDKAPEGLDEAEIADGGIFTLLRKRDVKVAHL